MLARVEDYNRRREVHGILVQLPLPPQVDTEKVLRAVDPAKDVDGFHPENVEAAGPEAARFVACRTPTGIMELLKREGVELSGRRAVVVGQERHRRQADGVAAHARRHRDGVLRSHATRPR